MTPSALPTITGAIASVSMSGPITEEASLSEIVSELAEIYGVDERDVETSVDYVASGTLGITIPEDASESEVITALQSTISDVLGVHVSDIVVSIDDDGVVSYSISSDSYKDAEAIHAYNWIMTLQKI